MEVTPVREQLGGMALDVERGLLFVRPGQQPSIFMGPTGMVIIVCEYAALSEAEAGKRKCIFNRKTRCLGPGSADRAGTGDNQSQWTQGRRRGAGDQERPHLRF